MSEPLGQILPDSAFGRKLTELARQSETIVEVGTWHGEGSTRCLANGLVRPTQRFWTIEQDKACWEEARARYLDKRITFINAHVIEIFRDLAIPIDLLLLDGHDEQTDDEFDAVHAKCGIIALDDTNERKNRRQLKLLTDWRWKLVASDSNDRNGWAIFQRP